MFKPNSKRALLPILVACLVAALATFPASAEDLTLEQILANYYEAIGGQEAWQAVKTMKQQGKMTMGPMEAPFRMTSVAPNKMRMEFEIQGMTGIQAFDGETGWMLMPFTGSLEPEVMPEQMVKQMQSDLDVEGVLVGYQDKGHEVELVGLEEIEGTQAHLLRLTLKGGHQMDFFLDAEYFIPIATRATNTLPGMGEVEVTTMLSDYKEVEGLMIPHSVTAQTPMGPQTLSFESIELNSDVDDGIFAMPEKAAAEGE